jgi:hypothetical protein
MPDRCLTRAGLRSGDGPLSVRVRPSSLKRDRDRRATSTGAKCLVNVHAKSHLTLEPLRTLRSEDKGQAGTCPDRTRAIPCTVRAVPVCVPRVTGQGCSWVAVHHRTAPSSEDRPRMLAQPEPIRTATTRATNAVRVGAVAPYFRQTLLCKGPGAPSSLSSNEHAQQDHRDDLEKRDQIGRDPVVPQGSPTCLLP